MSAVIARTSGYQSVLPDAPNDSAIFHRTGQGINFWQGRIQASVAFDSDFAAYEQRRAENACLPGESDTTWFERMRSFFYVPPERRRQIQAELNGLARRHQEITREPIDKRERLAAEIEVELRAL